MFKTLEDAANEFVRIQRLKSASVKKTVYDNFIRAFGLTGYEVEEIDLIEFDMIYMTDGEALEI